VHENPASLPFPFPFPGSPPRRTSLAHFASNSRLLPFRRIELRYSDKGLFLSSASERAREGRGTGDGGRGTGDGRGNSPDLTSEAPIVGNYLHSAGYVALPPFSPGFLSLLSRYCRLNSPLNELREKGPNVKIARR
jgi:hypothetical protein